MRTSVSILLLIVALVLGISTNSSNSAAVQAESEAAASANARNSRSGYGVGQFWWSSTPASAICEHDSYPVYDAAASELLLMRGGEFARVLERDLAVSGGISAAPECHFIAASVADRLVIWEVASGARVIELPNAARDPLVLWSPDGESALIAADQIVLPVARRWRGIADYAAAEHPRLPVDLLGRGARSGDRRGGRRRAGVRHGVGRAE